MRKEIVQLQSEEAEIKIATKTRKRRGYLDSMEPVSSIYCIHIRIHSERPKLSIEGRPPSKMIREMVKQAQE